MAVDVSGADARELCSGERLHHEICDASALTVVGDWIVVANDEDCTLTAYKLSDPEVNPVRFALNEFLGVPDGAEPDIEGCATIGALTYWITSHGANASGKKCAERHRFFATRIRRKGGGVIVEGVGTPFTALLETFANDPRLSEIPWKKAARTAPEKKGGLNIEGLAAMPGGGVLIGFRNPIIEGKALLVPLLNPEDVISRLQPQLGEPVFLDLGNRGVRSIEYDSKTRSYLIVAGAINDERKFQLCRWSGRACEAVEDLHVDFGNDFRPEGLALLKGGEILLISDDGGDAATKKKSFRSRRVKLDR